ncbi:MAG: hypothetical protein K2K57_01425 [Oscillospiraceae bacterium]|nr:hypothetical protein [Oscillospiraceae bacterium]
MCEVIKKICEGIECGAYGHGQVSLLPSGERTEQELMDGGRLVRIGAVIRAGGYESEEALLAALDETAERLENFPKGEKNTALSDTTMSDTTSSDSSVEILGIRAELPGVAVERREDGYRAFEAKCLIWFLEK